MVWYVHVDICCMQVLEMFVSMSVRPLFSPKIMPAQTNAKDESDAKSCIYIYHIFTNHLHQKKTKRHTCSQKCHQTTHQSFNGLDSILAWINLNTLSNEELAHTSSLHGKVEGLHQSHENDTPFDCSKPFGSILTSSILRYIEVSNLGDSLNH